MQASQFKPVDEETVFKTIDMLQPKLSCSIDAISVKLLKTIKTEIYKPITLTINQILATGKFPDKLKLAKDIPLHKKDDNIISKRIQYVEYDNIKSDIGYVTTGVLQGSNLGPLLFIIYINDIVFASTVFKSIIYTDDTTLYSTLNSRDSNKQQNLNEIINSELSKIST